MANKKFIVDSREVDENCFIEELDMACGNVANDGVDEWLDECSEEVHVGCCTFTASEVLKNCDPIAYSMTIDDYKQYLYEDADYELNKGEEVEMDDMKFRIVEE